MKKALIFAVLLVCSLPLASDAQMLQGIVGASYAISASLGLVQSTPGGYTGSAGVLTQAFSTGNTAGNSIICAASTLTGQTITIADSKSNSYTQAISKDDGSYAYVSLWVASNIASGSNTVSFTDSNNTYTPAGICTEVTGTPTSSPLDKTASASYSFANPTSGTTGTTSQASEILFGAFGFAPASSTVTPGTGYTLITDITGGNRSLAFEYQIVSATGTYTATAVNSGVAGAGVIATFK